MTLWVGFFHVSPSHCGRHSSKTICQSRPQTMPQYALDHAESEYHLENHLGFCQDPEKPWFSRKPTSRGRRPLFLAPFDSARRVTSRNIFVGRLISKIDFILAVLMTSVGGIFSRQSFSLRKAFLQNYLSESTSNYATICIRPC